MTTGYNFFAPFFQVFLIPPGGEEVPLWQGPVPQSATDAGFTSVGAVVGTNLTTVTELTVDVQLRAAFLIKITLNPSYEDGLALLSSNMIQNGLTMLKVRFGYVGSAQLFSGWYLGLIQNPSFSIGTDVQITLEGHPKGATQTNEQKAARQFVDLSRREIIKLVAAGSGKKDTKIKIVFPAKLEAKETALMDDEIISIEQGGRSDLQMIGVLVDQTLCEWVYDSVIGTEDKPGDETITIHSRGELNSGTTKRVFRLFGPPKASKTSQKLAAGVYGGISGESSGIFPILSVTSQSQLLTFVAASRGYAKGNFNEAEKITSPMVKEKVQVVAPSPTTGPAKAGKSSSGPQVDNDFYNDLDLDLKGGGAAIKVGDQGSLIQVSKNLSRLVKEVEATAGIRLTVETVGIPDFKPTEIVEIQGMGVKMDGMYSVLKVTHTLGSGGYTSRFECICNGGYKEEFGEEAPTPTTAPTEVETTLEVPAQEEGA